jgi:hypothetical protein
MSLTTADLSRPQAMSVTDFYHDCLRRDTPITAHLPRLQALANGLDLAVEFGVQRGASSSSLLMGAKHVISYDIVETPEARTLQRLAEDRWTYRIQDSRQAAPVPCDLLFVDSLHTFAQVTDEMQLHADSVTRYLVFHDVLTFGSVGARAESGEQSWTYRAGLSVPPEHLGIRPAIDGLMIRDRSWQIAASYTDSHGLLVLERRPA